MKRLSRSYPLWSLALLVTGCAQDDTAPSGSPASPAGPRVAATTALLPSPWTDPAGDVTLSNADMTGGTIVVGNGTVELRVRFVNPPFPLTATHFINWCIDLDQNAATGDRCGASALLGADAYVDCRSGPGRPLTLFVSGPGGGVELDAALHLSVDAATNTVRICFAESLLSSDSEFSYVVASIFGGSAGANDFAPNTPGFQDPRTAFVNEVGTPGPCCPSITALCDLLGARADEECPCTGPWRNHGAYVACVAHTVKQGLTEFGECLSSEQRDQVSGCVVAPRARSDCGRVHLGSSRAANPVGVPSLGRP